MVDAVAGPAVGPRAMAVAVDGLPRALRFLLAVRWEEARKKTLHRVVLEPVPLPLLLPRLPWLLVPPMDLLCFPPVPLLLFPLTLLRRSL